MNKTMIAVVCGLAGMLFTAGSVFHPVPAAWAQQEEVVDTLEESEAVLYIGDIIALKVYSLTRIAVSQPGVVEIVNADVDEILLTGKRTGETQFFIWDEYGKRTVVVRVLDQDLTMIQRRIERLMTSAEIAGVTLEQNNLEGKIVATGKVNAAQKEEFDEVVNDFSGYLINMVQEQQDLIQIDAQVTELETTLTKALGVQWSQAFDVTEDAVPGAGESGLDDIFRIGDLSRTSLITATVNALLETSQARNLSRPSVVVADGEDANILVGGEIPIVSTISSDGAVAENVEYKNYGVELTVIPTIRDDDKIEVTLTVSVRDVGTSFGDNTSFTTTTADTKVLVDSGQTIILAGLIKQSETTSESKVPFLHNIPILGAMFRYKSSNPVDKEVVISLTPYIRRQKNKLMTAEERQQEEQMNKQTARELGEEYPDMDQATGGISEPEILSDPDVRDAMSAEDGRAADGDNEKDGGAAAEREDDQGDSEEETGAGMTDEAGVDMDALLDDIEQGAFRDGQLQEGKEQAALVGDYARRIQQKIAQRTSFPYEAQEAGWKGTVQLSLHILSDGTLSDVTVKESSGRNIFDKDALNTAEIVSPFEPFPVELEMKDLVVTIPVVYSQQAMLSAEDI
ncbi:MAG: TonB family protein [Candidatus Omnitrophota bacterium]